MTSLRVVGAAFAAASAIIMSGCCGYGGKSCNDPMLVAEVDPVTGEPSQYDHACLNALPIGIATRLFLYWFDDTGEHPYKFADVKLVDHSDTVSVNVSALVSPNAWASGAWTLDVTATSPGPAWIALIPDVPDQPLTFGFAVIADGDAPIYAAPDYDGKDRCSPEQNPAADADTP